MKLMKGIKASQNRLPLGEYCFASRWGDGSPCDPWFVGFLHEISFLKGRVYYILVGNDGVRSRQFKNCMSISGEEGDRIIAEYPEFEAVAQDITIGKFLNRRGN